MKATNSYLFSTAQIKKIFVSPKVRLKATLEKLYGVAFTDTAINIIINSWCKVDTICFVRPFNSSRVQVWIGKPISITNSEITIESGCEVVYESGERNTINNNVTSSYQEYPTQKLLGSASDFCKIPSYEEFNKRMYDLYNKNLNKIQYASIMAYWIINESYVLNTSTLGSTSQYMLMLGPNNYQQGDTVYWVGPYSYYVNNADVGGGIKYYQYVYPTSQYISRCWGKLEDFCLL
jgi:hypothetical protein